MCFTSPPTQHHSFSNPTISVWWHTWKEFDGLKVNLVPVNLVLKTYFSIYWVVLPDVHSFMSHTRCLFGQWSYPFQSVIVIKQALLIKWISFTLCKCYKWPSQPCRFQISCLCQLPSMALVNIWKSWTVYYRDNTFLAILYQLQSVLHESKILEGKTALHGKLDTEFILKISSNPHQFIYEVWLN